jgi:AraC-like DNA-binding protein
MAEPPAKCVERADKAVELLTYRPPPLLRRYVQCLWTVRCPRDDIVMLKMFANVASGLIIKHQHGRSALPASTGLQCFNYDELPKAFVYGKRTQPGQVCAQGPFELTGAVFKPQGLQALLRIDAADVNDGPVNVDDVIGTGVADRLFNAASASEGCSVLGRTLSALVANARADDGLVADGLRFLHDCARNARIPQLLQALSISERQFERRFVRAVGVSPHHYLRIARFQKAARLLRIGRFDKLSDVAAELNYADQSHFIKDTREFSAYTPTALWETVRAAVELPCALILAPAPTAHEVASVACDPVLSTGPDPPAASEAAILLLRASSRPSEAASSADPTGAAD